MFKQIQENSDLVGIFSSSLCLIHCLLLPIIANLLAHSEIGEEGFVDYAFLVLAFIAIWYSIKPHTSNFIKKMLWVAFIILSFGILTEDIFSFSEYLAYFASFSLIFLHYFNFRSCQKCTHAGCKN